MSQVNTVSAGQNNNYRHADYKGALLTAGIGGAAWGSVEYLFKKTPFINDTKGFSDEFIHTISNGLEGLKDKKFLENKELQKTLETQIDNITTKDKLLEFFKNNKKELAECSDDLSENLKKLISNENFTLDQAKTDMKWLFEYNGKQKNYIKEIYESCKDEAGKLVHDAQKISKEKFDLIKNTANKLRRNNALKSAAIFAVLSAATMCIFEYFISRKAKKQAQKNAQQQI